MVKWKKQMTATGLASKVDTASGAAMAKAPAAVIWAEKGERVAAIRLGRLVFCILYGPIEGPGQRSIPRGKEPGPAAAAQCATLVPGPMAYNNGGGEAPTGYNAVGAAAADPTAR